MIARLPDGRRVVVVLPGERPPSAWRVFGQVLLEAVVFLVLLFVVPALLFVLAS